MSLILQNINEHAWIRSRTFDREYSPVMNEGRPNENFDGP
jgi:hypothetical protein